MDDRRPAKAGAQNPAYRPAHPPVAAVTCAATICRSLSILLGGESGDLPRSVPVDREQNCAQHDTVIPMEAVADSSDQFLGCSGRILVTSVRDSGPSPCQFRWAVFPEPHC
jgi:hypothetical protein